MTQIKDLDLTRLRQEESFGFHQLASAEMDKCDDPKLTDPRSAYATAINQFDESLKMGGANPLSAVILALDADRDGCYAGLATQIRNATRHFDPDKATVAKEAELILRKYGNPCSLPLLEENGVLYNLIQELEVFDNVKESETPGEISTEITTNRLSAIGALEWLEQLKRVNGRFLTAFTDRNAAQSSVVTGLSKAARQSTDAAYRAAAKRVNALAEVNGSAGYSALINNLNTLIDRQKAVLAARQTTNERKKEAKAKAEAGK